MTILSVDSSSTTVWLRSFTFHLSMSSSHAVNCSVASAIEAIIVKYLFMILIQCGLILRVGQVGICREFRLWNREVIIF